ncbi:hypothetical protein GCM10010485_66740 [Streptosporangium carneum]
MRAVRTLQPDSARRRVRMTATNKYHDARPADGHRGPRAREKADRGAVRAVWAVCAQEERPGTPPYEHHVGAVRPPSCEPSSTEGGGTAKETHL